MGFLERKHQWILGSLPKTDFYHQVPKCVRYQEVAEESVRKNGVNSKSLDEMTLFDWQRLSSVARSVAASMACLMPVTAFGLGVGGVETRSYIGEPLRVEIPLYNVEAPTSLEIELERLDGADSEGLTAVLSRANSQLSILIESEKVVNEPYFNFSLNLTDQGNEFRKQFTVLLNLSPSDSRYAEGQGAQGVVATTKPAQDLDVSKKLDSHSIKAFDVEGDRAVTTAQRGSLMGPYDWAKAGQIPEKFGAVLDGQSLWRVARRISPAMNATNNQMMWALYNANPQAFSNTSIESLRAGSFLTIPSTQAVIGVSDREAKRLLGELNGSPREPAVSAASSESIADRRNTVKDGVKTVKTPRDASSGGQFQLSSLGSAVTSGGSFVTANDDQSKEIIASLSNTISSMTEQLGRKDKQIEVLEAQVSELKAFIQGDDVISGRIVQTSEEASQENADADEDESSSVLLVDELESNISVAESDSKPLREATLQTQTSEPSNSLSNEPTANVQSDNGVLTSVYFWLLAVLASLVLIGVAMRSRLAKIWRSLNFSGANDQVEFQPSVFNEALSQALAEREKSQHSVTVSREITISERDSFDEPFSDSFSEPFSESFTEVESEIFVDEVTPEEELDFNQRFARLVAEGDLEFARQLLDIAHGHDVNDERYHFHRLQLLALKYDEDAFYDYYYSIESDIPQFTNPVQTDISKLVVQLAKN